MKIYIVRIESIRHFDDCEYRHKAFLLGLQIQMLITSNPIDLEQLNIVSSKLKELNNQK